MASFSAARLALASSLAICSGVFTLGALIFFTLSFLDLVLVDLAEALDRLETTLDASSSFSELEETTLDASSSFSELEVTEGVGVLAFLAEATREAMRSSPTDAAITFFSFLGRPLFLGLESPLSESVSEAEASFLGRPLRDARSTKCSSGMVRPNLRASASAASRVILSLVITLAKGSVCL